MKEIFIKVNKDKDLTYPCAGYVLGIDKFSYLFGKTYNISEIKKIKEKLKDKKIFVSFNRIIFNDEIEEYKKALKEVDDLGLSGIIIGDIAALTYNLKTDLILDQMHLNNSYYTINHYYNNGCKGIILTNDITLDEINEIRNNTKSILFKEVFGYPHLSTSNRHLVSNYFKHFKLNKTNSKYYMINEGKNNLYYHVVEDDFGCHILGANPINLLKYTPSLNVDYFIIDGYLIDDIKPVLDAFLTKDVSKSDEIDKLYDSNADFINKKTIYKVKKDEK